MLDLARKAALAAAILASGAVQPALAQDQVTLKFTHMFPPTHFGWKEGGQPFTEMITEATGGEVQFQNFPAGQLGKDYIGLLGSGLADMAVLVGSYMPDKLPLTSVSELPVKYGSACEATGKLWAIAQPGGPLYEAEYKPQGLRPLFVAVLPTYKAMTTSRELRTLDDLKGLKLRASGAAMEQTARALGAVPVQIQAPEVNDSLRRGTMDGAFWPYHSAPPYELDTLFKYGLEGPSLGSTSVIFAISEKKWEGLSDKAKAAFEEAAAQMQPRFCKWLDQDEARVRQEMIDQHGYVPVTVSAEEELRWQEKLAPVIDAWAQRMDGQGLSGTAILQAFHDAQPLGVD